MDNETTVGEEIQIFVVFARAPNEMIKVHWSFAYEGIYLNNSVYAWRTKTIGALKIQP